MSSKLRSQSGFTLIEVVIALSVVTVGLLSTLVVANTTVRASDDNERKVTATNLAREGLELVRNIRDSNWQLLADEQRLKAQGPSGLAANTTNRAWDCAPTDATEASGPGYSCAGVSMASAYKAPTAPGTFQVYPALGNSFPYLVATNNTLPTQNSVYLLCRQAVAGTSAQAYGPIALAGTTCPSGSKPYYRRIVITSVTGHDNAPNILVQSYVSWPGRKPKEVMVEEYLTNWRKIL
jgi:prepilin-type N-terminal cleavage/methylation domain-containing protein